MNAQNEIRRTIILPTSRDKVWEAITNPTQIVKWFGDRVEFDNLAVGEMMLFGWEEDLFRGIIADVAPKHRFAYHWEAGKNNLETPFTKISTTLVTFTLEEVPEGTKLTLIETGFAALPEELKLWQFQENTSGWNAELKDLQDYFLQPTE